MSETAAIVGAVFPCPTNVTTLNAGTVYVNEKLVTVTDDCGASESVAEVIQGVTEAAVKLVKLNVSTMSAEALVLMATIANAGEAESLNALINTDDCEDVALIRLKLGRTNRLN